jgi:hypothetical protein
LACLIGDPRERIHHYYAAIEPTGLAATSDFKVIWAGSSGSALSPALGFGSSPHLWAIGSHSDLAIVCVAWSNIALTEHNGQIYIAEKGICHDLVACSTKLR